MTTVLIAYTSLTGNTEAMADIVCEHFSRSDTSVTKERIEHLNYTTIVNADIIVIATYTYDDGEIPESTEELYQRLHEMHLSGKVYGVCGSGDTFYDNFCAAVDAFDEILARSGAIRGAKPVKVELYPQIEDEKNLARFVTQLMRHSAKKLTHDAEN